MKKHTRKTTPLKQRRARTALQRELVFLYNIEIETMRKQRDEELKALATCDPDNEEYQLALRSINIMQGERREREQRKQRDREKLQAIPY